MTKVNITRLDSVTSNDAAATAAINNNFRAIQNAVENTLSRDGTTPNFMDSNLDLNNHKIINVKDPEASTDVITKGWFDRFVDDASSAAGEALASALAAASSAQASNVSATEARDWATKMNGPVEGTNYSSKYYASQILPFAADITTVAGIASDVTAVANNSEDISTVAELSTEIQDFAEALSVYTSQEGHAGEYITTDGTNSYWDNVKLIENAQDENTLGIWQGSQQEWEQADVTDWKNWQTNIGVNGAYSQWYSADCVCGNGNILVLSFRGYAHGLQYNEGNGFVNSNVTTGDYPYIISFNNKFFAYLSSTSGTGYTSDDGKTWSSISYSGINGGNLNYANGWTVFKNKIYTASSTTRYSSSDGITWSSDGSDSTYYYKHSFATDGNILLHASCNSGGSYIKIRVSGDGTTWTENTYIGFGGTSIGGLVYFNNKFFLIGRMSYKTSSNGTSWSDSQALGFTLSNTSQVKVVNDVLYITSDKYVYYSVDGENWSTAYDTGAPTGFYSIATGLNNNGIYYSNGYANGGVGWVNAVYSSCYTTTTTPTTASTVYSAPNTTSALTITSVGTGTITLSDNQVYNRKASGDTQTYQDVASLYPNHLAFVDGTAIKKGNTVILEKGADKDLSNLSTAGKEVVSNLPMPSKSSETLTVGASGTSYTATANGWFCFSSATASASRSHLSIALNGVSQHLGMVVAEYTGSAGNKVFCPVAKGDSATVYYSNTSSVEGYFIYAEGDK